MKRRKARPRRRRKFPKPWMHMPHAAATDGAGVCQHRLQRENRAIERGKGSIGRGIGARLVIRRSHLNRAPLVPCQRTERDRDVAIHPRKMVRNHRERVVRRTALKPGQPLDLHARRRSIRRRSEECTQLALLLAEHLTRPLRRVPAAPTPDQPTSNKTLHRRNACLLCHAARFVNAHTSDSERRRPSRHPRSDASVGRTPYPLAA